MTPTRPASADEVELWPGKDRREACRDAPCQPQPRVGHDGDDVGDRDQQQVAEAEDHRAALDQRQVAGRDRIDHQLGDAGIVEDRLHDDDAAEQIGQRQRHRVDDRAERVGQRVPQHHAACGEAPLRRAIST